MHLSIRLVHSDQHVSSLFVHPCGYIVVKTSPPKYQSYALTLCCLITASVVVHTGTTVDVVTAVTRSSHDDKQQQQQEHNQVINNLGSGKHLLFTRKRYDAIIRQQNDIKRYSKIRTNNNNNNDNLPSGRRLRRGNADGDIERLEEENFNSTPTTTTTTSSIDCRFPVPQNAVIATPPVTNQEPMSPLQPDTMDSMGSDIVVIALVLALAVLTLGVLTACILSTYRYRGGGGTGGGGRPRSGWPHHVNSDLPSDTPGLLGSNVNLPMLVLPGGICDERLSHDMAALRDRHVRLKSVQQDIELDLPTNIQLPDGEEVPYGCSARLHIRDPEQESEIYQKCIRAPPNRTVYDGESPPPYRSNSAGFLSHGTSGSGEWSADGSDKVIRCHSMSSGSPHASQTPAVIVPTHSRCLSAFTDSTPHRTGVLSQLKMLPCHAERQRKRSPPSGESV